MNKSREAAILFRISALDAADFAPLHRLSDADLAARGIRRVVADERPGDPDVRYVHAHNARPGCYSCRIERA